MVVSFITLEEHYTSPLAPSTVPFPPHITSKLNVLGKSRIQDMDDGHVAMQILSHTPLDAPPALCTQINDSLADAISQHPTRLAGFALLPMIDPLAAAAELARCVRDLGFVGALLDNHLDGEFYDAAKFWPVFEKAQELDVPLYIHPTFASEKMLEHYKGNYADSIAEHLSAFGWGWHSDTGLHILRLYASGLFDRFPRLKIVIGHMGELLPFQLDRCIRVTSHWGPRERGLQQVWDENLWVTTSGMFSLPPLACLLQTTRKERVLYSVDYPFSTTETGMRFFEQVEKSGLLKGEELDMFAFGNAEKLLKLKRKA